MMFDDLMFRTRCVEIAQRLRSFTSVNGVALVPAGLLGDAASVLELVAERAGEGEQRNA
jgi:hypothetical protein